MWRLPFAARYQEMQVSREAKVDGVFNRSYKVVNMDTQRTKNGTGRS